MSAPPLSQAGPILEGHSFYNPSDKNAKEAISQASSVTGEATPPTLKECTQGPEESVPVEIPIDLVSYAPYLGEDARVTQLRSKFSRYPTLNIIDPRELDQMFGEMAGETSGYGYIPAGMVKFLPSITRGLIQLVGELQAKVGHFEMSRLQENQDAFQSGDFMRGYISWLQRENKKLQVKIEDLREALSQVEQNYTSMKAQKDRLKIVLDQATLNTSNEDTGRKRMRVE
ncbi:hypothetical protein HYALB_00000665 [Hymenoscyphus albidus]|uniref:Uncharacterized protein n=1 Tax=Hymenoscyphus albidus TaxID=595503 RepID=A0A9N9LSU9_9HELO|nr:hypothetical protein HYALB_00000665 [Hymenoscyphus albidus]